MRGAALLLLCTVSGLQAAPKSKAAPAQKAAAAPAPDELDRATAELDAFNRKTNGAAGSDADANLALQSVELQLKVVELTTAPRVKSSAQLEQNLARLADVKLKLGQAKKPKKGGAPAPAATLTALEQRRAAALEWALLLQATQLIDPATLYALGAAEVLHTGRVESQWATIKRNLGQVQSANAKAMARELEELAKHNGWPKQHVGLGTTTFGAITAGSLGEGPDACRKQGKDELAWALLDLQAATQIAMTKAPPNVVVAERMPHHDAGTPAGVARDVKRALFGGVLQTAKSVEGMKGCAQTAAAPRAPAGAGAHVRTLLVAAMAAEPLEELVTSTGYAVMEVVGPASLVWPSKVAALAKTDRAELDKRAQSGGAALTRYKAAVQKSKDGKVDPKDIVLARDELRAAKAAGLSATGRRAQVRKLEDQMMGPLTAADRAIAGAKEGMKTGKEAQKQLDTLLAQNARDAGQDAVKKAAAARASAIGKRAPDVIAYADGRIAEARTALQKHVTKAGIGSVADYPKRLAQAEKEDAAITQRLQTIEAQLKELGTLFQQDSARCDVRKVDWQNSKYDFATLKNGSGGECKMTSGDSGMEFETGETFSFLSAEYGDLDGDGAIEALVQIQGGGCGRGSISVDHVHVYGVDAKCALVRRASADFEQCSKRKLAGKTLQVDVNECSWDGKKNKPKESWSFKAGKLEKNAR
jgi:hypothetical protein